MHVPITGIGWQVVDKPIGTVLILFIVNISLEMYYIPAIIIFIFHCNAYSTLRTAFYHQISSVMPTFIDNNDEDKLNLLMNK